MNSIKWHGDETVDDLYDHWIRLVENGNRAGLIKELSLSANTGTKAHEWNNGALEYTGPDYDTDDMFIMELAYGSDADTVIEMVRESDDHEVGENLK